MQPRGKMKKVPDYAIGEHVHEAGCDVGRVASIAVHPTRKSTAYLLLVNSHDEYTICRGMTDAKCGLSLARNIPESVAMQFSEVIQGSEPLPSPPPKRNGEKFPVVGKSEPEPIQVQEPELGAPYFDFV